MLRQAFELIIYIVRFQKNLIVKQSSIVSDYNFAPTEVFKRKILVREGRKNIFVTGNTVIDALKTTVQNDYSHPILDWAKWK